MPISVGIYSITNKVNGKVYVGQSKNIARRLRDHKSAMMNPDNKSYNKQLYRDMREFGIENFDFKIEELCEKCDLDKREKYYVKKYDSNNNGYNLTVGGAGRELKKSDVVVGIIKDLEATDMSLKDIANKWHVNYSTVAWINEGASHFDESRSYPIQDPEAYYRRNNKQHQRKSYCIDCGKEVFVNSLRCVDCYKALRQRNACQLSREELKLLIRNMPFTDIALLFGVSDNAVRKWCDRYGLPKHSFIIRKMTDAQWACV